MVAKKMLLVVAATAAALVPAIASADLGSNAGVPASEKGGLSEVYRFEVPDNSAGWNANAIPYSVDNSATTPTGYTRVAYYLELGVTGNPGATKYAYASFDVIPNLDTAKELGVPSLGPNGASTQYGTAGFIKSAVTNLHVYTNANATSGTFATGGNLEFWPSNYGQGTNGVFDYDDDGFSNGDGHGSMQIHNGGLAETLIAYNAWGSSRDSELGVGTQVHVPNVDGNNPDWTFATGNNDGYDIQTMQIFVQPVPEPASLGLIGIGAIGLLARRRSV